jgi:hypothetical protein
MNLASIEVATGGLWPYLVIIIVGFLPTEVWRASAVLLTKNLDDDSEIMRRAARLPSFHYGAGLVPCWPVLPR